MGFGHNDVGLLIISLILSATFLVWVGDKKGNPNQRIGVIIAVAAILLSSLFILGRTFNSITSHCKRPSRRPVPLMMHKMERGNGLRHGMRMQRRKGDKRVMRAETPPTE